jgi:uncharacterized protein GlcG (DUF336 family)
MMDAARAKANEIGRAVSVVIVDAAGAMVLVERLDGAGPFTASVAEGKAAVSAYTGRDTAQLKGMAEQAPQVLSAIEARMAGQRFVAVQGGCALRDASGIAGAVGVSGGSGEEDEAIAKAAIQAY